MLPECRATGVQYDERKGTLTIRFPLPRGFRLTSGQLQATLLLAGDARPVGVDLAPESHDRLVVMIGTHEQVTNTRDTVASVVHEGAEAVATVSEIRSLTKG